MISSTGIENSTDTPDTDTPERSSRGVLDSRRGHNEADGKQRPLDSKTVTPELSRSRLFVCFVAALIVVLFAVMGLARLNGQNLFNPDSSRYTIMAKALVDGRGYRSIDWPGEPLYGLRPPGLSVLLMPAAWIFPYNTIAAKGVVLLLGIGLIAATLWLVGMTIRRDEFRRQSLWSIVIVGLLLASNPLTLLLSTEVLSEVPYAAISVAVLLLLAVWGDRPTWPRVILIGVLLGFLPFVRTVGVTLVAAVAAWAMFRRARWQWLGSVAMAVVATAGWMLRNSQLGNRGYGSYFSETLAAGGIPAVIAKMVSGLLFYLHMWASVLVPGTLPGRSTFWLALLEGDGIAPGPTALYGFASAVIILLSLWGMCVAKKQGGAICLWYIAATLTCLAIWPFRVERYIWPLVPVTWAFVPAALMDLKERLEFRQNATARVWQGLIGLTAVLILVWQTQACAHLVAPNVRHVLEPDRFFQDEMPPLYFCDWANAGNWLREHSDPTERILSRKSDIALSSRRYVRMVNFEMLDAQTLHREIQHDRIHYLAMIGRRFGSVFDWMLRGQDPVYRYETVYDDSGVVIARITPNRNWVIHASKDLTRDDLAVATQLAEEHPDRLEAQLHWAQLLSFSNQQEVALDVINGLVASGRTHVRLYDLWARVLTNLKRYDEAEKVLDEAARQPDSRVAMPVLQRTYQTLQREQERDRLIAEGREADVYLPLAKAYARNFSFTEAEEMLAKCPADTFQRADALRLRGELHFRFGRSEAATADLTEAFRLGETEAGQLLKLIRYQSAFRGTGPAEFEVGAARYTVDARSSADHVELVRLYREWELDGVALDHLEHAVRTLSDDSDIRILLVELQLFYGLWHDAEPQLEWLEARRSELSTEARADLDRLQVDFRELSRPARY